MQIYQFSNSANWSQVWAGTLVAQNVTPAVAERFYPIPDHVISIQIANPILAISATAPDARETWKYAGTAYQRIFTGLTVGGTPDSWIDSQKFFLDQITILRFQQLTGDYSLILRIPFWIRRISFVLWEYTGPIVDTTDQKLDQILQELQT